MTFNYLFFSITIYDLGNAEINTENAQLDKVLHRLEHVKR